MQQVTIGRNFATWGIVQCDQGKISIDPSSDDPGMLAALLASMERPGWDDETLFQSLPQLLRGRIWCSPIQDENGTPLPGKKSQGQLPNSL